jgi:hypothetical protein
LLPASSLATGTGFSTVGTPTKLPELTTGLSQFAFAEVSADELVADPISTLVGEETARAVGSLSPGFVENGLSDIVSHSAIDALFATNGWLVQASTAVESSTPSSDLGKTALAGVAGSVGLFGLIAAIRSRRRRAAAP